MSNSSCYLCIHLSKRPGKGNYFIYTCNHWGIICQNVLPQSVVISSIGKKCDFFIKKSLSKNIIKTENKKPKDTNIDLSI
jgi:hypothetical protein